MSKTYEHSVRIFRTDISEKNPRKLRSSIGRECPVQESCSHFLCHVLLSAVVPEDFTCDTVDDSKSLQSASSPKQKGFEGRAQLAGLQVEKQDNNPRDRDGSWDGCLRHDSVPRCYSHGGQDERLLVKIAAHLFKGEDCQRQVHVYNNMSKSATTWR